MKGKEEGGERDKAQEKKEDEATTAPLPERVSQREVVSSNLLSTQQCN